MEASKAHCGNTLQLCWVDKIHALIARTARPALFNDSLDISCNHGLRAPDVVMLNARLTGVRKVLHISRVRGSGAYPRDDVQGVSALLRSLNLVRPCGNSDNFNIPLPQPQVGCAYLMLAVPGQVICTRLHAGPRARFLAHH